MEESKETNRKRKHFDDLDAIADEKKRMRDEEDDLVQNLKRENENSGKNSADTCPICLSLTKRKLLGRPKKCGHHFCLRCLKRWSKRKNTCPVCRTKYRVILVQSRYTRKYIKQIPVRDRTREDLDQTLASRYVAIMETLSRFFINFVGNLFVVVQG